MFFCFHFSYARAGGSDGDNDMVVQEDTIFVSGMDTQTTEEEIISHFGAIGIIKVSSIVDIR